MADIFQFYAGSADAAPGKGAGETLGSPASTYNELRKINNWRRILSNFAVTPFTWDGHRWNTVEHAFQAEKFKNDADTSLYLSFTLDSNSELGKSDGSAAQKKRKARILSPAERTAWDARSQSLMEELWKQKFTQSEEARRVLLLTGDAQLWHAAPRAQKVRWEGLETIREKLRKGELKTGGISTEHTEEKMEGEYPTAAAAAGGADAPVAAAPPAPAAAAPPAPVAAAPPAPVAAAPPTRKRAAPKTKKNPAAVSAVPESVVASEASAPVEITVPLPDSEAKEPPNSTLKFCPKCRNYLYMQVENSIHFRLCRCCGYRDADEKGGLLSEILIQERSSEGYKILLNEHTRKDPRLPHIRGVMKCPSPECKSNHGVEPDIIYMKYDSVNLLYLYICDVCGFQWRSRR